VFCNFFAARGSVIWMKLQMVIRRFAGAFVLLSLLLAHYHSRYWLWFTAFVGFNLIQSSFTNFCPLEIVLKKAGVGRDAKESTGHSCCERHSS
jgi:hypothetical protein